MRFRWKTRGTPFLVLWGGGGGLGGGTKPCVGRGVIWEKGTQSGLRMKGKGVIRSINRRNENIHVLPRGERCGYRQT